MMQNADRPRVLVSVVSGARRELIGEFVRSLLRTTDAAAVDLSIATTINAPDRALGAELEGVIGSRFGTVKINEVARGFAANHNTVIGAAEGFDYFVVANDDVVVLDGAVEELVRFAEDPANERVAVVSPQLLNEDRSIQPSTYSFPSGLRMLLSLSGLRSNPIVSRFLELAASMIPRFRAGGSKYWAHDESRRIDTVRGAFLLIRVEAVRDVGLMDEVSLVGGEETEWHKRMRERGWFVAFDPKAEVVHLGGQTVNADKRLVLEYLRGWLNYFAKHAPRWRYEGIRAGAVGLFAVRWLVATLSNNAPQRSISLDGLRIAMRAR